MKGLVPHLACDDFNVELSDLDTNLDHTYNHRQGSQRSHSRVTTTNGIRLTRSRLLQTR